jgi:hypothetical protein
MYMLHTVNDQGAIQMVGDDSPAFRDQLLLEIRTLYAKSAVQMFEPGHLFATMETTVPIDLPLEKDEATFFALTHSLIAEDEGQRTDVVWLGGFRSDPEFIHVLQAFQAETLRMGTVYDGAVACRNSVILFPFTQEMRDGAMLALKTANTCGVKELELDTSHRAALIQALQEEEVTPHYMFSLGFFGDDKWPWAWK